MIPYVLTRERRRSLRLTVEEDGSVRVAAPRLVPRAEIDRFVESRAGWIEKRQARLAQRPVHRYADGERFPFAGETLTLRRDAAARRVRREGDALVVPALEAAETEKRVTDWYKAQAKALFARRLAALSEETGIAAGNLRLSSARTRWGSCGAADGVNINWRLALAPPEILDYVIIHELCHIRQRNHGKAFWALVQAFCPDWKARRSWLREHGDALNL